MTGKVRSAIPGPATTTGPEALLTHISRMIHDRCANKWAMNQDQPSAAHIRDSEDVARSWKCRQVD
jgi:hypothetical protein